MQPPGPITPIPLLDEYLTRFGSLGADPLCPELLAWNTLDYAGLWRRARELERDAAVPYWGIVWPGGRALARHLLDNAKRFKKRRVLDIGTGSGITAVAAARAGAEVTGIDTDAAAVALASMTAEANGVTCRFERCGVEDISEDMLEGYDLILAGDIFNNRAFAEGAMALLRAGLARGVGNLLSDAGRSHAPVASTEKICRSRVPVFREIEGVRERDVTIFRIVA